MKQIRVALYGENGHQIQGLLESHPRAKLVAIAGMDRGKLSRAQQEAKEIRCCQALDDLLNDPGIDLISLCSPRRQDQAHDAIRALRAGKHVYAEKPCAMDERALDEILRVSQETGCHFREMAGTAFEHPYEAMRRVVQSGKIGDVVQILAEKSYPYHAGRPQDEAVDGGLIGQCAIHGLRMVEQVGQVRIEKLIGCDETTLGNPVTGGGLRMAALISTKLANGGLATVTANYLNPQGSGVWGYETLRICGTLGMVESLRGGETTRLVIGAKDCGALERAENLPSYLDFYLRFLLGERDMPMTLEEELSPLRWAIRAKQSLHRR